MKIKNSKYITSPSFGNVCPVFRRTFRTRECVQCAELEITALGVYEAELNGRRIGDYVLAPGWTAYQKRLQVQKYDVTELLGRENDLQVIVGRGWFRSPMPGWMEMDDRKQRYNQPCGLIALLTVTYADGSEETICTDDQWQAGESPVRFSEIYDGEHYDARFKTKKWGPVEQLDWSKEILIPQEGECIREMDRVIAKEVLVTPAGETVVDFGQEVTGYVEIHLTAASGDLVRFTHGEMLDAKGNFYNENYRSAKALVEYTCSDGEQVWHPRLTFFGFRFLRLLDWPGEAKPENFTAVAVYSDMRRTGWIESGDVLINRLFSNVVWGQRGNFLDVPTDCPQRDERLGWTGDAEVFIKAAAYNYDVERFFRKWLHDLAADQRDSGEVGQVIPDYIPIAPCSAAWGDAATICPWQIYQTYGDLTVLKEQYDSMKAWVDFIGTVTETPDLWTGHFHFGDWLAIDAPEGSYKGKSREDFVASAFYANSTLLLIKSGRLLGKDMSSYDALHERIVTAFRQAFPDYRTQTEHVVAIQFGLSPDPQKTADALAAMIEADGHLCTGFVGTPHLLHVLSDYGYGTLAWKLLLRREYPSWLFSVRMGATTIWEHWDGIREDGSMWSEKMNSFNHYAYGSVVDWIYEKAAGLSHTEDNPGFSKLCFKPLPCRELGWLRTELKTRSGTIRSMWQCDGNNVRIELETPVPAIAVLPSGVQELTPGSYVFWENLTD